MITPLAACPSFFDLKFRSRFSVSASYPERNGHRRTVLRKAMAQAFTVLFVDDDELVRPAVAELLKAAGFQVFEAGSAPEAVRILTQKHVDVLFTDIVMPDLNGVELAIHAKQLQPGIRVMFATGYSSRATDAAKLGKVLFKPVRAQQIEDALNDVLHAPH